METGLRRPGWAVAHHLFGLFSPEAMVRKQEGEGGNVWHTHVGCLRPPQLALLAFCGFKPRHAREGTVHLGYCPRFKAKFLPFRSLGRAPE